MPEEPKVDNIPTDDSSPTSAEDAPLNSTNPELEMPSFDTEPSTGPATTPDLGPDEKPSTESSFSPFGESSASPSSTPSPITEPIDLSASLASEIANSGPVPVPTQIQASTQVNKPNSKKPKKTIIIAAIIAIIVVVLAGGAALAYSIYQNPQKVITDAIVGAINTKVVTYTGSINLDSKDMKASVKLTAKQNSDAGSLNADISLTMSGKEYTLTGDGVISSSGDLYVKMSKLDSVASSLTELANSFSSGTDTGPLVDKLITKIDGTWIKISSNDLKTYSESLASSQSCFNTVSDKYKNDKEATDEIGNLYQKNQFIVTEKDLGVVNGSVGYQLKTDDTKAKAFTEGLKTTKIYTALHDCDSSFTVDASTFANSSNASDTLQLWANQWTHQLSKIVITSVSDGTTLDATIIPDYSKAVTIDIPKDTTTLAQLSSDIEAILTGK